MRKPLIVIKLGGSALTDKTLIYTPRPAIIQEAARQVATIIEKCSLVLVHGAGSYGHIPVRKFGLTGGFKSPKQLKGLATTKLSLLQWEATLDKAFLRHGIPSVPFVASDFVVTKKGRIIAAELNPLKIWLRLGCVPTTGGDIVPDCENGFSILSGDQLASFIAIKLKARLLIFATDVDGIYDSDPKLNRQAHLLRDLTTSEARSLVKVTAGTMHDVTGGMAGKIREAIIAANHGIPVYFINLTKDDRLQKVAQGQEVINSRIVPQ